MILSHCIGLTLLHPHCIEAVLHTFVVADNCIILYCSLSKHLYCISIVSSLIHCLCTGFDCVLNPGSAHPWPILVYCGTFDLRLNSTHSIHGPGEESVLAPRKEPDWTGRGGHSGGRGEVCTGGARRYFGKVASSELCHGRRR